MGGTQSTQSAHPTESLYKILGVERNASDDELKRAYKKKALELHPDRNFDNAEEATTLFAKVQAAYDVLSSPQERAWYDNHGTRGAAGTGGMDDEPEYGGKVTTTEELKTYFDPTLYQSVDKRQDEFYDLVGQLFEQLKQEEHEASLDLGEEEPFLPSFGDANSQWGRDIRPFYETWGSFSSIKSFAWEDVYRVWDTPDRRTRRAAEQRNKKIRDAARKEFNSTVRQLVGVIKSKDPRVKLFRKNNSGNGKTVSAGAKEQSQRARKAQQTKRKEYQQQEWEKTDNVDEVVYDGENVEEDDDYDESIDLFECVVCDKIFKSKKQLTSHESSKKHLKNLQQMRNELRKEGIELGFDELGSEDDQEDSERIEEQKDNQEKDRDAPLRATENAALETDIRESDSKLARPVSSPESDQDDKEDIVSDSGESDKDNDNKDPTLEGLLSQLEGSRINSKGQSDISVKGKAKQKRQKKEKAASKNEFANRCTVCQSEFPSRNKLFDHVKVSGHALAPPTTKKKKK